MKFNKAAMFGLDARIALAIFGALSVISRAALYSAIQQSKVTAEIATINEIEKAFTAYYLDAGNIPVTSANNTLKTSALVENTESISTWNGPYIGMAKDSTSFLTEGGIKSAGNYAKDTTWGHYSNDAIPREHCVTMNAGETCYLWIARQWVNKSISEGVDVQIDGSLTIDSGNVRLWCDKTGFEGKCTIYYKMSIPANI